MEAAVARWMATAAAVIRIVALAARAWLLVRTTPWPQSCTPLVAFPRYWYPPPVLETYVLDETQPFTLTHASEGMRTNISHLAPTKYIDGA